MFLDSTLKRNPALIRAGIQLHQQGMILPDTYVLDYDQIMINAKNILIAAKAKGFRVYYMSKQFGRNPIICHALEEMGYDGAVCVDFKEALTLMKHHCRLSNVGHLVQTPKFVLEKIINYGVDILTVYSLDKLKEIQTIAKKLNIVQPIMLKILETDDVIYDGQQGGFHLEELENVVLRCQNYDHIILRGVTSFPCFLFDENTLETNPTTNLYHVLEAKRMLETWGIIIEEINTPSSNSLQTLDMISKMGGNTIEPGHALTGTTPYHQYGHMEELPAMIYVSEISHNYEGHAYCYGGGHYRRSHMKTALVVHQDQTQEFISIKAPNDENIDYHFALENTQPVSDTVIMSFRTQIFTTRSHVVVVSGIHKGELNILGTFNAQGYAL